MAVNSIQESRLGINRVLTNLAQGVVNSEFKLRLIFPLAETTEYGGQIIEFDDTDFEEYEDARADDAPYPEVQDSYSGRPFVLDTRGLSYRVPDKRRTVMDALRINWGKRATQKLTNAGGLKHEIQCAQIATDINRYAPSNRLSMVSGSQLNDASVDPGTIIRTGKARVSETSGRDPNVWVMGRDVFDILIEKPQIKEQIKYTSQDSITAEMLAAVYGFERVVVCEAQKKTAAGRRRVWGKDMLFCYTNPAGLTGDRIPFRLNDDINIVTPSFGYTYVYTGHPFLYNSYYDVDRGATVYKMDFDRQVVMTGVDKTSGLSISGYLVKNAVA